MSPRAADPAVRAALIDTAARLLVDEGPAALSVRRLTREVGVSTIAVYTHFEGMDALRRAVAQEGFARLAAALRDAPRTGDPVAHVALLGVAYLSYGVDNSDLYRFVFRQEPEDADTAAEAFTLLVDAVQRAVDAGRFTQEANAIALQLWVTMHGLTSLHLAGLLSLDDALATLRRMGVPLLVGFGDDPEKARGSVAKATARPSRRR